MSADILAFPTPAPKDGGKARILRRREARLGPVFLPPSPYDRAQVEGYDLSGYSKIEPILDLTMRHSDPEDTAPCEYQAPTHDGA